MFELFDLRTFLTYITIHTSIYICILQILLNFHVDARYIEWLIQIYEEHVAISRITFMLKYYKSAKRNNSVVTSS